MVAEVFIDRAVKGLKCRNQQNNYSSGREDTGDCIERCNVIFDVFQNIDDGCGVRMEFGHVAKFRRQDVADAGAQVVLRRVARFEMLDAFRFDVDGDDGVAIEQRRCEISDTAADFEDSGAQFVPDQAMLPGEVILCLAHSLLIF